MDNKLFNELLRIVYEYSDNNKLVDSKFYIMVWDLFKGNVLTNEFLNDLILINAKNENDLKYKRYVEGFSGLFGQAAYDYIECNLVVYEDNLRRNNNNLVNVQEMTDSDKVFFFNFLILQTLLHEYEHVLQEAKRKKGLDFESNVLRLFYDSSSENISSYNYSIYERLAEVNSCNLILKMIENIGISSQYIYHYFNQRLNNALRNGYHFEDDKGYLNSDGIFVSPTETYAKMRGKDIRKIRTFMKQVNSLDERLKYGFPISIDEYNIIFNDSNNLKR